MNVSIEIVKKSVSFKRCKIGLSHYPVKIIEIE